MGSVFVAEVYVPVESRFAYGSFMQRLAFLLPLVAFLLIGVVGCGPKWQVVSQASPNPFHTGSKYFMVKPSFEGLHIGDKTRDEYAGGKDADTAGKFKEDLDGMVEAFSLGFTKEKSALQTTEAQPSRHEEKPGTYVVKANFTFIEPGFYGVIVARATEVHANVKIMDESGKVIDELSMKGSAAADIYRPSVGQRMRNAAEDIGELTAKYMKMRGGLEK